MLFLLQWSVLLSVSNGLFACDFSLLRLHVFT